MSSPTSVIAVIPAAGDSTRFGGSGRSKILTALNGLTVIERAVQAVLSHAAVDCCVIATRAKDLPAVVELFRAEPRVAVVQGGAVRQESVDRALRAARERVTITPESIVLVHDAARCLVPPAVVDRVIDAATEYGAAVAAVPVVDTLKRVDSTGVVNGAVDRQDVWAMQTPQAFRFEVLQRAHDAGRGMAATDDVTLVEHLQPVRVVLGDRSNIKITTQEDFNFAEQLTLIAHRCAASNLGTRR